MGRCCSCSCSGAILAALNVVTLIVSLVMVAGGVLLAVQPGTACDRFMQAPLYFSGVFLFVVSFLGLIGSCCRVSCMLWLYLIVMFLLIVGLACFTAFAFVVTNEGAGDVVSGKGYKEYRLGDYSHWLRRVVTNKDNWENIESCLKEAMVCGGALEALPLDPSQFYKMRLSSIQSGCCKPPAGCGVKSLVDTVLVKPERGLLSNNGDCKAWSSDSQELCFGCNSCKAGVLANVQMEWKVLALFNVALLLVLVVIYCVGCCAVRSNKRDRYQRYRAGYRP